MSSLISKSEVFLKKYKTLAQVPSLTSAKLYNNTEFIVSVWSQRNVEKGKTTKFQINYIPINNFTRFVTFPPIDISTALMQSISQTEKYLAIVREVFVKDEANQFLEIWTHCNMLRSIDLTHLDLHGKVYIDGEFASMEWSPDENSLVYVAEKKVPKKDPLHKRPKKKSDNVENSKDEDFKTLEYRQDWGEQLAGKISPNIIHYDLIKDEFTVLEGIPENVSISKPIWAPQNDYLVGVAYKIEPRKLGLIYCTNRPSTIFKLDLKAEFNLQNAVVNSPRFTPDGKSLIWLQAKAGGPHNKCFSLVKTDLPLTESPEITTLIDIVENEITIANDAKFYGLFNADLRKNCWSSDGRLIFTALQKNSMQAFAFNLETRVLTLLTKTDETQIILDVCNDVIAALSTSFLQRDSLVVATLPTSGDEGSIVWKNITEPTCVDNVEQLSYALMDLEHDNDDALKRFSAMYVGPKSGDTASVPTILFPHGGPHSASLNRYSLETAYYLSLGYAIIYVNYRGSVGAGEYSVNWLPGRVGQSDVSDCILAMKHCFHEYPWLDIDRVVAVGGSHGGFLVTHLGGQYPDTFKAIVSRNGVMDIASMSIVSDIPDWCYVEGGCEYTQEGQVDDEILVAMRKKSPIEHAHKIKAPVLLQVGTKDLRVPPSQSIDMFHRLKANNANVSMNMYDDDHAIAQLPNEVDNLITIALWLDKYNVKK